MSKVCEGVGVDTLIKVVKDLIGVDWKQLARPLNFSETDIGANEYDNKLSLKEQIFQLFFKWKMREGNGATSDALLNGLIEAKLERILDSLEKDRLIERTGSGYPIQEIAPIPEQPRLIGMMHGDAEDVEVDEIKKKLVCSPNPAAARRPPTGEASFETGDMVSVKTMGYGVIRWLGYLTSSKDQLIAGIEFEERVPGGNDGTFGGSNYFTCDSGFGLFLPCDLLSKDHRFTAESSKTEVTTTSPAADDEVLEEIITTTANDGDDTNTAQPFGFLVPNDRVGLVIGRDGKNIREVERLTNTSIMLPSRTTSLVDKTAVIIKGSKENCKKAFVLIKERLDRKVALHTAASDIIRVPHQMVGRIIGKSGTTIEAIKSKSGVHDIKFEKRGTDLEQDCILTGSRDEIEEAKKLIEQKLTEQKLIEQTFDVDSCSNRMM